MTPPKLLITTSVPSTLSAFLLPYATHFKSLGWQVEAATNGPSTDERVGAAFDALHQLPWTRSPRDIKANFVDAPRALARLVTDGGYDLVHAHDPIAAFVTRYALRSLRRSVGVRVVYTAHGFHFYKGAPPARYLVFRGAEELAAAWTDALIVINRVDERAARQFLLMGSERVRYMPGIGVDLEFYDPDAVEAEAVRDIRHELQVPAGARIMLMVAEFNPGKRHADAVDALAISGRRDVILALAGEGPEMKNVQARARAAGVSGQVRLLGYRNDVRQLLAASFATILPSEREGLPRAIMESLAMRRPTIATRIRGVTELVSPDTGILVEVGDVDGMARAIQRLASEPEAVSAMGARGREAMREFDLRNVVELHEELYERLLSN